MNSIVEKVRALVKKECNETDWKYHILPVVYYAKLLARKLDSDEELAELGALLHDIGWIRFIEDEKNHDIRGIPEAEKILKDFGADKEIIEEVKHCVESHRSSKNIQPRTMTAKIIANADGMTHFDLPYMLQIGLRKKDNNLEQAIRWSLEIIERNWSKKLTLPEAREMIEEKYKAAKLILKSMLEYSEE